MSSKKSAEFTGSKQSKFSRYSVFSISDKLFALEILTVKEVLPLPRITPIPNVAAFVLGVFNLRGTIITLCDIRYILGIEQRKPDENGMILVLESGSKRIGILVEKVLDIVNVEESNIQSTTRNTPVQIANLCSGLYEKEGLGLIHLIDGDKLINSHELQKYR